MSKYHATPVWQDGYRFDSQAEARRYGQLHLLEKAGIVTNITVHKRYPLEVNGRLVATYEADFVYYRPEQAKWVTEDVKGVRTQVYKLKRRLMLACYGIEIQEVEA